MNSWEIFNRKEVVEISAERHITRNYFTHGGDRMTEPQEKKWTVERVHQEVSEARNKMFVVTKVLETGSVAFADKQEWVVVIKPLLRELEEFSRKVDELMGDI